MKKKYVISMLMLVSVFFTQAQNTHDCYYFYDGARKEVPVSNSRLLVYFDKSKVSFEEISNAYSVEKEILLNEAKADSLWAFMIDIGGDDYDSTVAALKNRQYVYDVEPVIGVSGYTLVSNTVYVQLNALSDTSVLKTMTEQVMATYEGLVVQDDGLGLLWCALSTNKDTYNALEMSILIGESGLFMDVDPGFIYTIRCNVPHPSDAMHSSQWSVYSSFPDLWAEGKYGDSVSIAIIDDGVDVTHNEFAGLSVTASADYVQSSGTNPANVYGSHATNVAGVIFSNHNQHNIAGIAPHANLINYSAINTEFSNPPRSLSECSVPAIYSALSNIDALNVDIVLCPWEFLFDTYEPADSRLVESAIDYMLFNGRGGKGTVLIFAAGKADHVTHTIPYPANYKDEIIVVGASDQNHDRALFSCYGDKLDVVAPGKDILTTSTDANGLHGIVSVDGTSVAAAHVAGLVALMLSENSNLTLSQIDWILKTSAYKSPNYTFGSYSGHPTGTWNEELGYGEVNVSKAWNMIIPGLVVKDNNGDNGVEPTALNVPFESPSIEVVDVSTGNPTTLVYPGGTFNVNVTLHNFSESIYRIDPADMKLYYRTHLAGNMLWNSSFSNVSPITPIAPESAMPVTLAANGGSHTFTFQITLTSAYASFYLNNSVYITFVAMFGHSGLIHNYDAGDYPLENFIASSRYVAGKTYLHYEDPWDAREPFVPINFGVRITPNPTPGKVMVELTDCDIPVDATIAVTDMFGNRLITKGMNGETSVIDFEGKPSGNYYVFLIVNNEVVDVSRVVVY